MQKRAPHSYTQPETLFNDLAKRKTLVEKLKSRWAPRSWQDPEPKPLPVAQVLQIVRDLNGRFQQLCEEGEAYNTAIVFIAIRLMKTSDLMGVTDHGLPAVSEVILTMAQAVLELSRPVLQKHGFSQDLEGLAQMDQMLREQLSNAEIFGAYYEYLYSLVFGRFEDVDPVKLGDAFAEVKALARASKQADPKQIGAFFYQSACMTRHLLSMGIVTPGQNMPGYLMSYIQHLALPPLERRLRSYARTIAFVDNVVGSNLQRLKHERVASGMEAKAEGEKRERVIWIWGAKDHCVGELARQGYFEEACAFQPEKESMVIYLIGPTWPNAEFAGNWPYGAKVPVHAVTDHSMLLNPEYVRAPDMVFFFNMDFDDFELLYFLVQLTNWAVQGKRPVIVITLRCEAEVKKLKQGIDLLGLQLFWHYTDAAPHYRQAAVRNPWSGMASSPDIEYDDNGWVAALYGTSLPPEKLASWVADRQAFENDLWQFMELSKYIPLWTESLVNWTYEKEGFHEMCRSPKPGDRFTDHHLACMQMAWQKADLTVRDLVTTGALQAISPEEEAAWAAAAAEARHQEERLEEAEGDYRVVFRFVILRAKPSTEGQRIGMHKQGDVVRGTPRLIDGERWLQLEVEKVSPHSPDEAWMLMDGQQIGLGQLLERIPSAEEKAAKAAKEAKEAGSPNAAGPKRSRPAVFWGILDLKYDSGKLVDQQVKVLETGDGRLSRFSGYGASIKESFQQEHKLEATLRRAVITENKKLTHDVIVDTGYEHLRPQQLEFRRQWTPDLAERICVNFGFDDSDICVLKLCNRARGAGVIPVRVVELDEVLRELLTPPSDLEAWLKSQPKTWARTVTWGCFEEQVRHWWSNEAPFFLVEDFCMSMLTEKEGRHYDGTMRVGFSLHREVRNKLPPGWVDSPDGPVRVHSISGENGEEEDEDVSKPLPWNDPRRYLDLFRTEDTILRVQWLGGYWKLPLEDVHSQDLRGRIVSVAKQGTAPVPDADLHAVYAALGNMVPLLFGTNDLRPNSIKDRYKHFPELGAFLISRLAVSLRGGDRPKCAQLLELAKMTVDKEEGVCKDQALSYIHRNVGVADAMQKTWESAAQHFRTSIAKLPANANSRHLLGLFYLETGSPQKAIETLEESLLLDPDFKAPYACLGVARLQLAQYHEAAEVSRAGLARHPHTPACQYNLGVACFSQALLEERERGGGHIAAELRAFALEALVTARDQRFKEHTWEPRDELMVVQLTDESRPLAWSEKRLPQDGWRVMGWRP